MKVRHKHTEVSLKCSTLTTSFFLTAAYGSMDNRTFLLSPWRAVRSYLEERDPIWGEDWSHSLFIRRSPSWGFLGFSSAVRQMPGDLCTAPRIILLSLVTDVTDATLGTSGLWLGTRTGVGRSPWLHWQQVEKYICNPRNVSVKLPYVHVCLFRQKFPLSFPIFVLSVLRYLPFPRGLFYIIKKYEWFK